jgi:tetratricopeptide (TPR) repeat protein
LKTFGPDHPDVARAYEYLGSAYHGKGVFDRAADYYEKALKLSTKTLGPHHPDTKVVMKKIDTLKKMGIQEHENLKNHSSQPTN